MEVITQFGWLPVLVVAVVATIVAGVILKVTGPKKAEMSDREKFERYGIGDGPAPGEDPDEYWRDFELMKQAGGKDDEYFKDDQM